jgi:hypothetical protein
MCIKLKTQKLAFEKNTTMMTMHAAVLNVPKQSSIDLESVGDGGMAGRSVLMTHLRW